MENLRFPKENDTAETRMCRGKEIVYRFWENIPYAAKPVDLKYQTLSIKEPISDGGKAVDAAHAPIFFGIGCVGFLSSTALKPGHGMNVLRLLQN